MTALKINLKEMRRDYRKHQEGDFDVDNTPQAIRRCFISFYDKRRKYGDFEERCSECKRKDLCEITILSYEVPFSLKHRKSSR